MTEVWLRTNRRALAFGLVPPLLIALVGLPLAFGGEGRAWVGWLGIAMTLLGTGISALLAWQMRVPRIAYRDGQVFFTLRPGKAIGVPVEIVEAFFVGQAPLVLPGHSAPSDSTMNLVARLSQRATEWLERDVKPALGRWSDGYVVVNGAWCEPLDQDLLRRLNRRLREAREHHLALKSLEAETRTN
jgi:hypothetical protein